MFPSVYSHGPSCKPSSEDKWIPFKISHKAQQHDCKIPEESIGQGRSYGKMSFYENLV